MTFTLDSTTRKECGWLNEGKSAGAEAGRRDGGSRMGREKRGCQGRRKSTYLQRASSKSKHLSPTEGVNEKSGAPCEATDVEDLRDEFQHPRKQGVATIEVFPTKVEL